MRIHQHFSGGIGKIKSYAIGVGRIIRPLSVPPMRIGCPYFDLHFIEIAWPFGDRARDGLLAFRFSVNVGQTHGDALDRNLGRVFQDAEFPKHDQSPDETIEPSGESYEHEDSHELKPTGCPNFVLSFRLGVAFTLGPMVEVVARVLAFRIQAEGFPFLVEFSTYVALLSQG